MTQLHYTRSGQGPTLLIIGGVGDSTRNWSAVSHKLSSQLDVIVVDNIGAGESPKPKGPYTIEQMAQAVRDLLDHLQLEHIHILGYSMGGKIAMQLAYEFPHLVQSLILLSTGPGWHEPFAPSQRISEVMDSHERSEKHFKEQFEILFGKTFRQKFKADSFVKFQMQNSNPQPEDCFLWQLSAVKNFDFRNKLKLLIQPTLILAGKEDLIAPPENSEWMHKQIPHSELKIFENAGHVVQGEQTKEFCDAVFDWCL